MTAGKSFRFLLADGMPAGLPTAEIMNWTGHVSYGFWQTENVDKALEEADP